MKTSINDFGYIRVASAAPECKVAAIEYNLGKIKKTIDEAEKKGAQIILFPEMSITSYSCADLFFQKNLITRAKDALIDIANYLKGKGCAVIAGLPVETGGMLFNCAAVITQNGIEGIVPKTYLSNEGEFYEERWFSSEFERASDFILIDGEEIPFGADLLFRLNLDFECIFGIEICQDLWAVSQPSSELARAGANLILNLSASNEILGKFHYRKGLVKQQSARCNCSYVYSSCGPGESTTDLVFSGHCFVYENGKILAESERFRFDSQLIFADIDIELLNGQRLKNKTFPASYSSMEFREIEIDIEKLDSVSLLRAYSAMPFVPSDEAAREETCREIFDIQSTGLAKRILHIGCKNVVIGISGGLDSTLALLVCVKAFQKISYPLKGIRAISMPGFGTSARTKSNAEKIAKALGVSFIEIDIKDTVLTHFKSIGHDPEVKDIVFENAQARARTMALMDYANKINGFVVGTGDMSELALGWCTYNADQMSMYNVNSGAPKTLVRYIVGWFAESLAASPQINKLLKDIIDTPISPELLPADESGKISQKTEELIGPYELNDYFLFYSIRHNFRPEKILYLAEQTFGKAYKFDDLKASLANFYRRFFSQQFKRSCSPDGVKIGTADLSPRGGLRMPSDASYEEWVRETLECGSFQKKNSKK